MRFSLRKALAAAAAALLILAFTVSVSAAHMIGDADGDGEISSIDVTTAQRVIAKIFSDDDGSIAIRADVTGGGLSQPDVTAIQRYLAGLADGYQIGKMTGDDFPIFPTEDNQLPIVK